MASTSVKKLWASTNSIGRCRAGLRGVGVAALLAAAVCPPSTREVSVSSTWRHLGFHETTEEQLAGWNVEDADLVHMQNTLQVREGGGCKVVG
jgi:hypothetical protein